MIALFSSSAFGVDTTCGELKSAFKGAACCSATMNKTATLPLKNRVDTHLALNKDNVHWGYFSKDLQPKLTIKSGETVTVEMASHHACDDYDKMVKGDPGMESVFDWNKSVKGVSTRGA